MAIGYLTIHLLLPGCTSLKEKRSRIKPLIVRMQREFNISVAEMDRLDAWQEAILACALVSNDHGHAQRSLQKIVVWIENSWPDVSLIDDHLEMI